MLRAPLRCVGLVALFVSSAAPISFAQESWKVGGLAGAGIPAVIGGLRLSVPGGPKVGFDLDVASVGDSLDLGPLFVTDVRWMRGGRAMNGNGRYWILGAAFSRYSNSTPVYYPGHEVRYLVDRHAVVLPRIGYGWDHVAPNGVRAGVDLTSGAAGETEAMLLVTAFVMWSPPRR